jgi:antitoxin MazE
MKVKIAKWGNSLGVRLPKQFVDALDLKPGTTVDLERDGSRLAIETVLERRIPHYRLEDLLAQVPPLAKQPPFEDWGILPSEWPREDWSDVAPTDEEWSAHVRAMKSRDGRAAEGVRSNKASKPTGRRGRRV